MKIINGNTALRSLIPNTLATVPGEPTWYEKMYPYLAEAETWLQDNISGEKVLTDMEKVQDNNPLKVALAKIIVCHALMNAIPSLDVVLTPNGFGIVNTSNIAPASRDRVERLIANIERERDMNIDAALRRLPACNGWTTTTQGLFFGATLFPDLQICNKLAIRDQKWENFLRLREKIIKIENVLAETYFSQEQMAVFRMMVIKQESCHPLKAQVIRSLRSYVTMLASDMEVHNQSFYDLVNIIRENELMFPEWHASETARLYSPAIYLNKKESTGYWF